MSDKTLAAKSSIHHRYTITSEGASRGYFRLVEDPEGAWVTWAEVEAALASSVSPTQEPLLDRIERIIRDGHYSILRSAMSQRSEAGQRIFIEELTQLVREASTQ